MEGLELEMSACDPLVGATDWNTRTETRVVNRKRPGGRYLTKMSFPGWYSRGRMDPMCCVVEETDLFLFFGLSVCRSL